MDESHPGNNFPLSKTVMTLWLVSVCLAHEYGYWRHFGIRILEHVGFADLPRLAVWPVLTLAGSLITGFVFGIIAHGRGLTPGAGAHTRIGRVLNRYRRVIALGLFGLGMVSLSSELPIGYLTGAFWMASGVWLSTNIDAATQGLGIPFPRTLVAIWIFFLCSAYGIGNQEALNITSGAAFISARSDRLGPAPLRYLGRAADYIFLWNPKTGETQMMRLADVTPVFFARAGSTSQDTAKAATSHAK